MSVLLAGGGSAGHTSPLLATAEALTELVPDVRLTCLGTARGLEATLIPAAGLPLELVPAVPLPRQIGSELLRVPSRLRAAVRAAGSVLERVRPDVLVGFGGYVSVPAYLAARRRRLAVVVHEGNALPGLANRLGARMTPHVAVSFPGTPLPHPVCTGLPIRRSISRLDRTAARAEGRAAFGLDADRPTLLVTGGSQGARRINAAVSGAARELAANGIQVLHHAGRVEEAVVLPPPGAPPYVVLPYIERMDLAYAAADLVVCRAGANTVTEVAAIGLPAVFVPLPIGNGEQARNAQPVVAAGGGLLVDDASLDAAWVRSNGPPLLLDAARLATMSQAARHVLPRDGAGRLARLVVDAAGSRR
ncbi:MAG: undecaprenyldiphospho-muramoylpentapeptide beta-N-acetylglucosaminyltransferase [Nocardioidaceae bacterium]